SGTTSVDDGAHLTVTIAPDVHYHVADVTVDGVSVGPVASYTFADVTTDHTFHATFALNLHALTASASAHGSIAPSGATSVDDGADLTLTIAPDAHHHIADVTVDGVSVGPVSSHTFTNVTADQTIGATFALTTHAIVASAGPHGSVSPSGATSVDD